MFSALDFRWNTSWNHCIPSSINIGTRRSSFRRSASPRDEIKPDRWRICHHARANARFCKLYIILYIYELDYSKFVFYLFQCNGLDQGRQFQLKIVGEGARRHKWLSMDNTEGVCVYRTQRAPWRKALGGVHGPALRPLGPGAKPLRRLRGRTHI